MSSETWVPWGKLRRDASGIVFVHPLLDHMTDVASVLAALLHVPALRRALEMAAGRPLKPADVARLQVLAFLHDIGKANTGFQSRYWADVPARPAGWRVPPHGHGAEGWSLFTVGLHDAERLLRGLPVDTINGWGEAVFPLLLASISHHGRPVNDAGQGDSAWRPVQEAGGTVYDPADAIAAMGERVAELYPEAFGAVTQPLPATPAFTHLFAGLVQLADWVGSDTRASFFPYTAPGESRGVTAPRRALHAVVAIGLDQPAHAERLAHADFDFARTFGLPAPRPIQAAMAEQGFGRVVVLESETGSGKTEAALWRFLHLWRSGEVDALYFALPTRVAATQLHERVHAFVQRVWPDSPPVVVRALPGYTAADGQSFTPLPDFKVLWSDNPGDAEADRRWAAESPKRYLAAPIAVGTIDQALLGALQIKHAHLRQALLSRSLLVVDEVHASDAYMTRLLEHLLRAHVACGGHALLLSATLGAVARTRYLSIDARRAGTCPPLDQAEATAYPAIASRTSSGPRLQAVEGHPRQKTVHWETLDLIDEPARVAALAVEAAARGARVLVVRNTVPVAVATLRSVEALAEANGIDCLFKVKGVSTLHHSRFSRQDRPLLDAEVQEQIGKHRKPRGGLVVIGTQTLEQSLDIDADLLITDLCPMDVLLQRLGRLHRHERPSATAPDRRPAGFESARAWVLTPPGHDLAPMLKRQRHGLGPIRRDGKPLGGVYADLRGLEATRRLIVAQPTRSIPADNRMLVERATHPQALNAIARDLGDDWLRFGMEYDGALAATQTVANLHALPFEKVFDGVSFPVDEGRIGSRLGAADRIVNLDPAPVGPFGQPVDALSIRHHLLPPGLALDAQAEDIQPSGEEGGCTFRLGSARYRYSRLGIERIKDEPGERSDE